MQAADTVTRLAKVITAAPMVVKGTDGSPIANPILRTYENSCTHMLRLAEQWGLTPSARGRINVGRVAPEAVVRDKTDRLFGKPLPCVDESASADGASMRPSTVRR